MLCTTCKQSRFLTGLVSWANFKTTQILFYFGVKGPKDHRMNTLIILKAKESQQLWKITEALLLLKHTVIRAIY